jgi:serine/threonine-protein phosphatase 6 regulatory ankyrin repeat subunit B
MDAKIAKCSYCGAENWNILGDADVGYVLSQGDGKTCLTRESGTKKAMTAPCDSTEHRYVPLQLQFASASDIKAMSSDGARLIGAASDGDLKAVQDMLKSGVAVDVRDWDDLTALIPAASSGYLEICKILVEMGIDVNAKDKDGITALMEASIMGHASVVEFLLENGADVNEVASSEVSALWLAASEGRTEIMKILLAKDADASNSRVDGITAVMTACVGGHTDAVALLLENGVDPASHDKEGTTALMHAAENGNVEIMKLLVEKAANPDFVHQVSASGLSPIVMASAHGKTEAVKYLLSVGSDANAFFGESKVTALMYAAAGNHIDAMAALIDEGKADLEARHSNGGTALLEAATGGQGKAVQFLIERGADTVSSDVDGVTPLMAVASVGNLDATNGILQSLKVKMSADEMKQHINLLSHSGGSAVMFAAAAGHVECAKALMAEGADIHAIARQKEGYPEKLKKMIEEGQVVEDDPHVDGVTGLHVAAMSGHLEMVKLLVDNGIDVSHKDDEGRIALTLAVASSHAEVAKVLVAAGSDPNTPYVDDEGESHNLLFDAIMVENEEFAILLIEKGADIYHADEKKVTTLLQASHRGSTDIVKALIAKNAGKSGFIDAASEDGITPLIAASSEGQVECVKALIDAKADVNSKDKDGTNALMAASARGHLEVVTALLAGGAAVNEQNTDGHTALMFAYNGKNQVETLYERYRQFVAEGEGEDEEGTMPIIKEALKSHASLIEILLKNGADAKLKDKEGHVAKDFDFQPDADAEILEKQAKAEKIKEESKNEL